MTDDDEDETERVAADVSKDTKEKVKAKLDHGGISREIRKRMREIAHGGDVTERERLKDTLTEKRKQRRQKKSKRDSLNDELDELEIEIERLESDLDDLRDRQGEYEGALQMLEEDMQEHGESVFPAHKKVQHAATLGDCSPEDVIADLKERNPDLPDSRFTAGGM
jgi:chromosome segregation ATPase